MNRSDERLLKKPLSRRIFLVIVSVVLSITVAEGSLRLLSLLVPSLKWRWERWPSLTIQDAGGQKRNPDFPGHDPNGFRNAKIPTESRVVTMGDSQTYGLGVDSGAAWPKQLHRAMHASVYNMAYPGYSPVNSLLLWNDAMALKPQIVLEGFYAGNDLYDSFDLVYRQKELQELKTSDPHKRKEIEKLEKISPIFPRITSLQQLVIGERADSGFLSTHSRMYTLIRRAMRGEDNDAKEWENGIQRAREHPEQLQVFQSGTFRTVFTSSYRLLVVDIDDPRIFEGLEISLKAIQRMQRLADAKRIRFLMVLIPTKETVFRKIVKKRESKYSSLLQREEQIWAVSKDFLDRNGIRYLDALPALEKQIQRGVQPYKASVDGHLNQFGHEAIARMAFEHIRKAGM